MKTIKVLNLYACLGGNRYKWDEVANIKVTAIEYDPELAKMYQKRFPNDTVIVTDAHQYLLNNYKEFDFIWSSPPCPSHSKVRISQKNRSGFIPKYPDLKLYEEIIFLDNHFNGKYVVENVIPYYNPLIPAQKRGRHLYWSNLKIPYNLNARKELTGIIGNNDVYQIKMLCEFHEIDLSEYKGKQRKDKIARNLVDFEVGKTIFQSMFDIIKTPIPKQNQLF